MKIEVKDFKTFGNIAMFENPSSCINRMPLRLQ